MDLKELFDIVDSRLACQPETALGALADELGVQAKDIEQAVDKAEGVTFLEYCENRRLAHAIGIIEEGMYTRQEGTVANQRLHPRLTVPGAVVRYLVSGRRTAKAEFSRPFPILDISRGGMAFFTNDPGKSNTRISLLICLMKDEMELRVEGKVVYSAAVGGVAGYKYRIGVCFQPFARRKGFNPPELKKILIQMERRLWSACKAERQQSDSLV